MIRHVSFDVWNTLIVPNPHYAAARTRLLSEKFELDEETVRNVYTTVKRYVDSGAEINGAGPSTYDVFEMLIRQLNNARDAVWESYDVADYSIHLRVAVERLFALYPPHVTESAKMTFEMLRDMNITASIASNSNFISGSIMHPYLQNVLGRITKIQYGVYSDRFGYSKPHRSFFTEVLEAGLSHGYIDVRDEQEYLHVGDSVICDVQGARRVGMNAALVTAPNILYTTVKQALEAHN